MSLTKTSNTVLVHLLCVSLFLPGCSSEAPPSPTSNDAVTQDSRTTPDTTEAEIDAEEQKDLQYIDGVVAEVVKEHPLGPDGSFCCQPETSHSSFSEFELKFKSNQRLFQRLGRVVDVDVMSWANFRQSALEKIQALNLEATQESRTPEDVEKSFQPVSKLASSKAKTKDEKALVARYQTALNTYAKATVQRERTFGQLKAKLKPLADSMQASLNALPEKPTDEEFKAAFQAAVSPEGTLHRLATDLGKSTVNDKELAKLFILNAHAAKRQRLAFEGLTVASNAMHAGLSLSVNEADNPEEKEKESLDIKDAEDGAALWVIYEVAVLALETCPATAGVGCFVFAAVVILGIIYYLVVKQSSGSGSGPDNGSGPGPDVTLPDVTKPEETVEESSDDPKGKKYDSETGFGEIGVLPDGSEVLQDNRIKGGSCVAFRNDGNLSIRIQPGGREFVEVQVSDAATTLAFRESGNWADVKITKAEVGKGKDGYPVTVSLQFRNGTNDIETVRITWTDRDNFKINEAIK